MYLIMVNTRFSNIICFLYLIIILGCSGIQDNVACIERKPRISMMPLSLAYAKTSINTSIFRCNSIVSDDRFQITAYYDGDGIITFAKRELGSLNWEIIKTDIRQDCSDAHKSISLAIDGEGYIHLAYGMHSSRMLYRKSLEPYGLNFSPIEYMIDSIQEQRVTYPEFYKKSNGNIIYAYRSGYSGNGDLVLNEYSLVTHSWKRVLDKVIDGENCRNAYWQMYLDSSDAFHLSWVWRETSDVSTNHDLCYAYSSDGMNWKNSKAQLYSIPIKIREAEFAWLIPQNSELINQTSMAVDESGHPFIASYWRDSCSNIPQYKIVWNDGYRWCASQVIQRSTPFSLSGGGTKRIPIARPKIVIDKRNRAFFLFRDIERGEVVSLAYCNNVNWPKWEILDLTNFPVEAWEPSIDIERWRRDNVLDIYVQKSFQGDGEQSVDEEAQMAYVLEVIW